MKDRKRQNGPGDASDIGVVRVFYNPGPDAEDRLRRLFALVVKHATSDRQAAPQNDLPTDAQPADNPTEAEASVDGHESDSGDECEGRRGD